MSHTLLYQPACPSVDGWEFSWVARDPRDVILIPTDRHIQPGAAYRLKTPMLGITSGSDGRRVPVTVATDALLTVIALNGETQVNVLWDGREITVFAVDLETRSEIPAPASSEANPTLGCCLIATER